MLVNVIIGNIHGFSWEFHEQMGLAYTRALSTELHVIHSRSDIHGLRRKFH